MHSFILSRFLLEILAPGDLFPIILPSITNEKRSPCRAVGYDQARLSVFGWTADMRALFSLQTLLDQEILKTFLQSHTSPLSGLKVHDSALQSLKTFVSSSFLLANAFFIRAILDHNQILPATSNSYALNSISFSDFSDLEENKPAFKNTVEWQAHLLISHYSDHSRKFSFYFLLVTARGSNKFKIES